MYFQPDSTVSYILIDYYVEHYYHLIISDHRVTSQPSISTSQSIAVYLKEAKNQNHPRESY